jgi:superfamily I DNA/RNA helicase
MVDQLDQSMENRLRGLLSHWSERSSTAVSQKAYAELNRRLRELQSENEQLHESDAQKRQLEEQLTEFNRKIEALHGKLEEQREKARKNKKKERETAQRRHELEQELKQVSSERDALQEHYKAEYAKHEEYAELLQRLTNLTRTRREFEERILRLTPEQEEVLDQISLQDSFLVRGAAGTGKSLVLLKALEKAVRGKRESLLPEAAGSLLLLTFQRSLVKYNRYLSSILGIEPRDASIETLEAFIREKLRERGISVEGTMKMKDVPGFDTAAHSLLSGRELQRELEDFLWANDYSYREYVEEMIPRQGLGKRLGKAGRQELWRVKEEIEERMRAEGTVTKNFSRILLLRSLEEEPPAPEAGMVFIDEVQDVTAVELQILRAYCSGPVLMAGDEQQRIFSAGSPFARSGINIRGRTRYLRTNFRNTAEIHAYAHRFLSRLDEEQAQSEQPYAFRHGPAPETHCFGEIEEMVESAAAKAEFFVNELGYRPEMICVAAPTKGRFGQLQEALGRRELEMQRITDRDFDFSAEGSVKYSTLHSMKGLTFPVVLLLLPSIPAWASEGYSEEQSFSLLANLLFVGMTRAMEHLNVFYKERDDRLIAALAAARE